MLDVCKQHFYNLNICIRKGEEIRQRVYRKIRKQCKQNIEQSENRTVQAAEQSGCITDSK